MKVVFNCCAEISDVYEVPDDTDASELFAMACDWVADNVGGYYTVIED